MSLQLGKPGAPPAAPSAAQGAAGGPGGAGPNQWTAKRYLYSGSAITVALFLGVGVWSANAMIAGAVIAPAELRVENNRLTVQHLEGGVVQGHQGCATASW